MDKNEELQKWLNDDRYIRPGELARLWGIGHGTISQFLQRRNIFSVKTISHGRRGHYVFYNKAECLSVRPKTNPIIMHGLKCSNANIYLRVSDLALMWGISEDGVRSFLRRSDIKPIKFRYNKIIYDRAECEAARPFINQPEKEVEKVEQVNLPEPELDNEELATDNSKALNENELAAIIDACKDPIDKTIILSSLCFGIRTGELDSLNLRDISGAEICLQSPSGVVKMRIPKQYEDARTELITYYVDNGNSLSGDMPVFLNRSGVRMTRQGLNNRMKSVSESANIGRDVKLADLRATFAQNIYKKTEKNISTVHKYLRLSENTNIMSYLIETQTKEQKTMPVDLMNSLTASYQVKEPLSIAEPKEQTPDIIPADTIDLFTMSELESELKQRGVELTAEVRNKINASDMPEMQHIATMIRGNAKTIAIRLSVLNEIARQLQDVESENDDENEEQDVFYSYHQASELLGISMGSLRNKVNAIGMTLKKNGVKAYFTANQIDSLRKQPKESDESPSAHDIDDKFNTILSRLKEIEYQVVYSENFGPSEDIINHFKSAIQSRSNVLAALLSRAKIVIHNESCVILLDQKFAVDKVGESKSKEIINNALMDIGCKDFNIYVLFSGKQDFKNSQN